jgi:predicted nucleic acid-binding protein
MSVAVLDSHALLTLLRDEPGAGLVRSLMERAAENATSLHMTEVNYAEVQYIVRRQEGEKAWAGVASDLEAAPIEFHPATRALADLAAGYKARFKLSLADAFAAALATEKRAELVTGDPEFEPLEPELRIHWLK